MEEKIITGVIQNDDNEELSLHHLSCHYVRQGTYLQGRREGKLGGDEGKDRDNEQ